MNSSESAVPLLVVKGLKKHFPVFSGLFRKVNGVIHALDDIHFQLNPGEVLGIVGESGSGKTTLGRTILRLIEPSAGEIVFSGVNLLTLNQEQLKRFRKEAQMIFQDPFSSLNPRKTIRASIGEGLLLHGLVRHSNEQKERVAEILTKVGLSPDMMYRYPHQFSGGQQQRICIARALALNPRLIVCDEALSSLDVSVQAQILALLQELKESHSLSYLFISHDLSIVRYLCDKILVLYLGQMMEMGSVEDIFNNPRHPYTQALLSAIPKDHPLQKKERIILHGDIPSPLHPPSGCPFRTRCPYAKPICQEPPPLKMAPDPTHNNTPHSYRCIL